MKLKIPLKHRFYTDEKLFELFCIENNFPKYSTKCQNLLYLFKYFVSYITIIPQNDTLLHHGTNQISLKYLCCIVLQNTFLAQEYMK